VLKYFPSGFYPEPSDIPPYLFIYYMILKNSYMKFFVMCFLVLYSAIFMVETTFYLLIIFIFYKLLEKFKIIKFTNSYLFYFISLLFYIICLVIFTDYFLFNDSAQNRITTPLYFVTSSFDGLSWLFGNGPGSITSNIKNIFIEYSGFYGHKLSSEQNLLLSTNIENDNLSIFNMHIRFIFEFGLIIYFLIFYVIFSDLKKFTFMGFFYWLINDTVFNPFIIIGILLASRKDN
jgi:hypothetical protein